MMRIQCERCGTKYRVAKEKIANRTVRVRCQRCHGELVIIGPPIKQPNKRLTRHVQLEARRLRQTRRRSFFKTVGRGVAFLFILLLVGLGSYFMATTPGIPKAYAVAFIALNGLVWGAIVARGRWNRHPDAPAQ